MPVNTYPSTFAQRVFIGGQHGVMCPRDFSARTLTPDQHANDTAVPCLRCVLMLRGYGAADADPPERMGEGHFED